MEKTKKMCINCAKMLELIFVSLAKLILSPWYRSSVDGWCFRILCLSGVKQIEIETDKDSKFILISYAYCVCFLFDIRHHTMIHDSSTPPGEHGPIISNHTHQAAAANGPHSIHSCLMYSEWYSYHFNRISSDFWRWNQTIILLILINPIPDLKQLLLKVSFLSDSSAKLSYCHPAVKWYSSYSSFYCQLSFRPPSWQSLLP